MPCKAHFYFPDSLVDSVRHSHEISAMCLKGSDPLCSWDYKMIVKNIIHCFALGLCLYSCSSHTPPHLMYRAEQFNTQDIPEVEQLIRNVANKWNLHVKEKDREQMKILSSGEEAFFVFLLMNKEVILHVGNVGASQVITLMFYDQGRLPISKLEQLATEIRSELENRFNLEFCVADPDTAICEEGKIRGEIRGQSPLNNARFIVSSSKL